MMSDLSAGFSKDCLAAATNLQVRSALSGQRIAVTGGSGFLGSWLAEMVAALNDEYRLGITLDLYSRSAADWAKTNLRLSSRDDIHPLVQDVRSPFAFHPATIYVVHAAGIPDNRVHASDPARVFQTTVFGAAHVLEAAAKLSGLKRLVNLSSSLVNGTPNRAGAVVETDSFPMLAGQLHHVYRDAKRAAESLCATYRSQFRLPVSTLRPFTFVGPYQELDRPWAINNFMRDMLLGSEIRMHGDGAARRSYLYGSDAAWWTLSALVNGVDGQAYNMGSAEPVSHLELIKLIECAASRSAKYIFSNVSGERKAQDDLYPDLANSHKNLQVEQTCSLEQAVVKTYQWYFQKNT
ncbi:NAD-dependent epimerase/dehydratase family protein [Janthinobacterium sp. LB2P49]|uniref:NAD-dependent epimerase/dehydratase family protein n=1 Tax=Janthinobacterium sp. LB2P49 TaxID=3424198 RepID=UPI003F266801